MKENNKTNIKSESDKKNLKNVLNSYKKLYNDNLKLKHIIIFIIMLILFFIMLNFFMNNSVELKNELDKNNLGIESVFCKGIKEKVSLSAIIIFAGITPFALISVLGIICSYTFALEIFSLYFVNSNIISIIIGSIGAIIQLFGISLSVATGIYYCLQTTKKFRYNQHRSFGIKDVKKAFYEIKKDEEKLKQLYEVEGKKAQKREKLNVKIPYLSFVISFVISSIFLIIGELLLLIVK